jgi:thioredoxin-like negative regulator of GroEL
MYSTVSPTVVFKMLERKILARKLLDGLVSLIDQSNIDEILETFLYYENHEMYAEALSACSTEEISSFFDTIEALKLQKKQLSVSKNLKKCILREYAEG